MSCVDKAHKKHQLQKKIEQAMKSPEFQIAHKKELEQAVLKAFCLFCFVGCEYLEYKHGYKKNGLQSFLELVKTRVEEIGDDDRYIDDVSAYYKDNYNLDVLEYLGLLVEKEG